MIIFNQLYQGDFAWEKKKKKKRSEFKAETGKEKELGIYQLKRAHQNPLGTAEAHQPNKN